MKRVSRPKAALARRGQRHSDPSNGVRRRSGTEPDPWLLDWLDSGHTHWWLRSLRWRQDGRIL
jgi:hypothetical protein